MSYAKTLKCGCSVDSETNEVIPSMRYSGCQIHKNAEDSGYKPDVLVEEGIHQLQQLRDWTLRAWQCTDGVDNVTKADLRRIELIMNKAIHQCHETIKTGKLPEGIV